ncbi:MAG: hypothetical protein HOV94_35680 [Saccharothrix sp.]|nr:hypothetical protein [Saccharothrix sp.]
MDPARLWSGGAATALAAGLTAVVGILVIRWLLDVPVLAPRGDGAWGNANTLTYALVTAAVALAATALVQLLAATTPNYTRFFNWIMMLVTAIAVVLPLSLGASLGSRIATAVLNLVLGLSITSALGGVARRATVRTGPEQWS